MLFLSDHNRRGISHDLIDQVILLDKEWKDLRYEVDQTVDKEMKPQEKLLQLKRQVTPKR